MDDINLDGFGSAGFTNPSSISFETAVPAAPDSLSAARSRLGGTGMSGGISSMSFGIDTAGSISRLSYSDPDDPNVKYIGRTSDILQLDADPFGESTERYGKRVGLELDYSSDTVSELNVFGKRMSAEYLKTSEAGRELLNLAQKNREGVKRGFLESLTDFSWSDLPFVSLFATVGKSIKDANDVSKALKKMQDGDAVSDDELIKTRLYLEEQRYRENGTWGSTVGDIIRAAPGFMVEFAASGGAFSMARSAAAKAVEGGIHIGMSRASKVLAREATEHFAKEAVKDSVAKLGAKAFADLAENGAKKNIVDKVATQVLNATMVNNPAYKGLSSAALREMATNRAEFEFSKMLARNANGAMLNKFNTFRQWLGQNVSRGLMDFGQWGTEESTVLFTEHTSAGRALADAVGTFLVEAPVRGSVLMVPNQLVMAPVVSSVAGVDKPVSDAQLSLQVSAYMTDNKELMDKAESIAFGMNLMEYVSENTGRGLKSLLRGAGLGLEKLGVKGLTSKASLAVNELGGLIERNPETERGFGSKMREMVAKAMGTREEFAKKAGAQKLDITARALGVTSSSDRAALKTALLSGNTSGLRKELADRIGSSIDDFADRAVKEAYDNGVKDLQYKSYARFAMANWMAKHQIGPETVMNLYEQMGYDGILGEMFEERYSDVVKGLIGLDDRAEHDFFSNLKAAVKGIWPGFDQLTAEAVGFAMPLVSRAGVMRLQSAVGGGGKLAKMRARLEGIEDALRHDSAMSMKYGTYLKVHEHLEQQDGAVIADLESQLKMAEASGDEAKITDLTKELDTQRKIASRRVERHQKFTSSLSDAAKANVDEIITVPILDNATLADDEAYARTPVINSDQAAESLAGQAAIVDYAPELARILYKAEAPLEGEKPSWFRRAAHKVVGIAGAVVTGDMSLAATNAEQWVARDMGLPASVCRALKEGYKREYATQAERLRNGSTTVSQLEHTRKGLQSMLENAQKGFMEDGETRFSSPSAAARRADELVEKIAAVDKSLEDAQNSGSSSARTYKVSDDEVTMAAERSFSARARQIMGAYLATHQLRSFSDGRMKDQALVHVAKANGYEYSVIDGEVSFGKFDKREGFQEGSMVSADELYNKFKKEVDKAHEDIVVATADLMTRHLTKSHDADVHLMNAIRYSADSDMLDTAIYDSALHMIGSEGLVHSQKIDGSTPLREALYSNSTAKVSDDVMKYIAGFDAVDSVEDRRAFEAAAYSLGLRFDGTEGGLSARDEKIFRMAKLANMLDNGKDRVFFTKPTAYDENDARIHPNGSLQVIATRGDDGSYTVDLGYKDDGKTRNTLTAKSYRQLTAMMRDRGFSRTSSRILFTQAKVIESSDMFHMIRELGLADEYINALGRGSSNSKLHPMLRKDGDRYIDEDTAREILERELSIASHWDPEASVILDPGNDDMKPGMVRAMYERVWGEHGYMRIGERLLEESGVTKNTVSIFSGEFSAYSPTSYTLSMSAFKHSNANADIIVQVDPMVNEDMTSGVVDAVLLDAFARPSSQRLLRNHLNSTISDFTREVDAAVDIAMEDARKAHDSGLVRELNQFRDAYTRGVDEEVVINGKATFRKGTGFRARAFVQFAKQFCAFGAETNVYGEHARAFATIAPIVRRCPSFLDFSNIVDMCVGGNGFLDARTRHAAGATEDASSQRGLQQLVSYMHGSPDALKESVRQSLPGGMSYAGFLDSCITHLGSMSKAGQVSDDAISDLEGMRREAETLDEFSGDPRARHFTFVGNLYGTLRRVFESGKDVNTTVVKFISDLVKDALAGGPDDQRSTEAQRRALQSVARAIEKRAVSDPENAKLVTMQAELSSVKAELARLKEKRTDISKELNSLGKIKNGISRAERGDQLREKLNDVLAQISEKDKAYSDLVSVINGLDNPSPTFRPLPKSVRAALNAGKTVLDFDTPEDLGTVDGTVSVRDDRMALPGAFRAPLEGDVREFRYRYGVADEPQSLTRGQARLAVNILTRMCLATGSSVDEDTVVENARRLFPTISEGEVSQIRTAFRTADNMRLRKGIEWSAAVVSGERWSFLKEDRKEDDTSSDNFNDASLSEYNSQAVADFLALAERCSPETSRNLQGFLKLTREHSRRLFDENPDSGSARFFFNLMNPKMNPDGKTQAEHDALHQKLLESFSSDDRFADKALSSLLEEDSLGDITSRRGALVVAYLMSMPENARIRFGKIVAHSVAATPIRRDDTDIDDLRMSKAFRASHGKVNESIVSASFVGLVGVHKSNLPSVAAKLRELADAARGRLMEYSDEKADEVLEHNSRVVADVISVILGRETPLYSALTSDLAASYRRGEKTGTIRELAKSVSYRKNSKSSDKDIDVIETIASTIEAMSEYGEGPATLEEVTAAFTAAFATGNPRRSSLRSTPRTATHSDPLMAFLVTMSDSLPHTVMTAEVDQSRDSNGGSSVAVSPRDMVPLVARWLYSTKDTVNHHGGVPSMTFEDVCGRFFGVTDENVIAQCRQDATWPDRQRTPICAKNLSVSYNNEELLDYCEAAYKDKSSDVYWVPIYAGDHSSSVMLQVPKVVQMSTVHATVKKKKKETPATTGLFARIPAGASKSDVDREIKKFTSGTAVDHQAIVVDHVMTGEDRMLKNRMAMKYTSEDGQPMFIDVTYDDDNKFYVSEYSLKDQRNTLARTSSVKTVRSTVNKVFGRAAYAELTRMVKESVDSGGSAADAFEKFLRGRYGAEYDASSKPASVEAEGTVGRHSLTPARAGAGVAKATKKDQDKFNQLGGITKYIGYGAKGSSTDHYAKTAFADIANKGEYSSDDVVGVSVNGSRKDRVPLRDPRIMAELNAATSAGATIIADSKSYRESSNYNVGESELSEWLAAKGYVEVDGTGIWKPEGSDTYVPYMETAQAICEALGVDLMYVDAKRSAISSLEAQGVGMIGVKDSGNGGEAPTFGENRVHIMKIRRSDSGKTSAKDIAKFDQLIAEAWKGSTFLRGYGAKALKRMAQDPKSSTIKAHIISTHGENLFFGKSLSVATDAAETGQFLEGTAERTVMDYLDSYRGASDKASTDFLTDFDSYKVGPGNSKSLQAVTDNGNMSVMEYVFGVLEKAASSGKKFSRMTGDELDALVGPVTVEDLARNEIRKLKLSELMPGVVVNSVDGFGGDGAIDVSYQENGAMAYTVANVSHHSNIPADPGKTPRNYEVDAMTMATALGRMNPADTSVSPSTVRGVLDLIANWGIAASSVYSDPRILDALRRKSETIEELIRNGENVDGQNVMEELAREVWAKTREMSNIPLSGIDAPLVSNGSCFDESTGKVYSHSRSRMHQAMVKGSELFSRAEEKFFGARRRPALCNVNVKSNGFRYGWFLDQKAFEASDVLKRYLSDAELHVSAGHAAGSYDKHKIGGHDAVVAKAIAYAFHDLRQNSRTASDTTASADDRKRAEDDAAAIRTALSECFLDHHNKKISSYGEKYVSSFGFEDLFRTRSDGASREIRDFDLTAIQFGRDRVHNDATGEDHIFLGGTMFGLPRTPSYNGSMWLQVVRAGLPVTEFETVDETSGEKTYTVGRDAMVSPDPVTNALLGCDHDGDKTKLYMFTVDADGQVRTERPPTPETDPETHGFDSHTFYGNSGDSKSRYLEALARTGMLEYVVYDEETGQETPATKDTPGVYYRISDMSRRHVSNEFVGHLFDMARALPVDEDVCNGGGMVTLKRRYSEDTGDRLKFYGGVASHGTVPFPVGDKDLKKSLVANSGDPLLKGGKDAIGNLRIAAKVSKSAGDASAARAQIVSMAKTLHLAWMSGYFTSGTKNLFFGSTSPLAWFRFMHHVDGLSNATFDDLKEQMCARLGWSSGMIGAVVTQIMLNPNGGCLPTTDAEFAEILSEYAKDIKEGGRFFTMMSTSDKSNIEALSAVQKMFSKGSSVTSSAAATVFGITGTGKEGDKYRIDPPETEEQVTHGRAVGLGIVEYLNSHRDEFGDGAVSTVLSSIKEGLSSEGGSNPLAGYLKWFVDAHIELGESGYLGAQSASGFDDIRRTVAESDITGDLCRWIIRNQLLNTARSFCNSINYLAVDPGNDSAFGKRRKVMESYDNMMSYLEDSGDSTVGKLRLSDGSVVDMSGVFERMHAATMLAYDVGEGLQSVAARAVTAANLMDEEIMPHLFVSKSSIENQFDGSGSTYRPDSATVVAGKLLLRDRVKSYDRMTLQANGQQIPYICGLFDSMPVLSSYVHGTPLRSRRQFYDAIESMAAFVGLRMDENVVRNWSTKAIRKSADKMSMDGSMADMFDDESGETSITHPVFAGAANVLGFRQAIESVFEIMYELISTSKQYNDTRGNKAIASLRMTGDAPFEPGTKFDEDGHPKTDYKYGFVSKGLHRISPQFSANNEQSVQRIRDMFDEIITGEAFSGARTMTEDRGGLANTVTTFSVSRKSIAAYVGELTGRKVDEDDEDGMYRALVKTFGKTEGNRRMSVVRKALAAVEGLQDMLTYSDIDVTAEITPAMMFGQFLPMYSVMTARVTGAPVPGSSSLIGMLPLRYYQAMSDSQVSLDRMDPEFMSALIATQWGPRNANYRARARNKRKNLATTANDLENAQETFDRLGDVVSEGRTGQDIRGRLGTLRDEARGGAGTTEGRVNPEFRHNVDIFADGVFSDIVDYMDDGWGVENDALASATRVGEMASGTEAADDTVIPEDKRFDENVAASARAMAQLLGSWCTVEYTGGQTFTISGKLRGNAAGGRRVLIVVDAGGRMTQIKDEATAKALANSRSYAESLCAAVDLGTEDRPFTASDFMKLSEKVRIGLVKKYGLGGVSSSSVKFSFSGRGAATLVGAISLEKDSGTGIYHEYFHQMMRMFEAVGLFTDTDYEDLSRRFGEDSSGRHRFNEERAAEAFRKWVQGNTDDVDVPKSVFKKILDFLTGLWESLVHGFNYRDASDDQLFSMFVHGIAQTSESGTEEAAGRLTGSDRDEYERAVQDKDAVKAAAIVSRSFSPVRTSESAANARELAAAEAAGTLADTALGGLVRTSTGVDPVNTDIDDPAWLEANLGKAIAKKNSRTEKAVLAALSSGNVTALKSAMDRYMSCRDEIADAVGMVEAPLDYSGDYGIGRDELAEQLAMHEEEEADAGADDFAGMEPADSTESKKKTVRAAVRAGTFKISDRNDFWRAGDLIRKIIENGLETKGSWNDQLESIKRRYSLPRYAKDADAIDRKVILDGIRQAVAMRNPSVLKELDNPEFADSVVFAVALRMHESLEHSFVDTLRLHKSHGKDEDNVKKHASRYDVSAWILSSTPGAAGDMARKSLRKLRRLLKSAQGKDAENEIKMHIRMVSRMLDMVSDTTGLMQFRDGHMAAEFDTIGSELLSGTDFGGYDERGMMRDYRPTSSEQEASKDAAKRHLATFAKCCGDQCVQESLKTAANLFFQLGAMTKFYQELDAQPAGIEDLEAQYQILKAHNIPRGTTPAEWMASNAIGNSNLGTDSDGLISYMNQPFFIANNAEAWLASLNRKSFGNADLGRMMMAENKEYAGIKAKVARLENYYSYVFGDNVEAGGRILEVLHRTGEYTMEDGSIVREPASRGELNEFVKFDNYNRKTVDIVMTEEDLRMVDMFKKAAAGYANGQDELVTGVDRLTFRESMMDHDSDYYSRENVLKRYEDPAYEDQLDPLEIALVRMTKQLPGFVLDDSGLGLYNKFVSAALGAMEEARRKMESERKGRAVRPSENDGTARFNSLVLERLRDQGLIVAHNSDGKVWPDHKPVWTKGAVCIQCKDIDSSFRNSETYRKLSDPSRGWKSKEEADRFLSMDNLKKEFMGVYGEAISFVKKHPWLTHGDGQYHHAFGTCLPFWRGSGVFMYNAVRANRDVAAEELAGLPDAEEKFLKSMEASNATELLNETDAAQISGMMDMFANLYGITMRGKPLVDAIMSGEFAEGTKNSAAFGVSLGEETTVGDVSRAIYDKLVDTVWDRQMRGLKGRVTVRSAERILDAMERRGAQSGEMFGGRVGITDEHVFRKCGVLPANYQIGHKVHVAIDGLTNAMMSRAVLANMLMTPAYDGAPVYYADPAALGAEASGIPDSVWGEIARWWSSYNGLSEHGYDPAKSGIQNAKAVFEALRTAGKTKDGGASFVGGKKYKLVSGSDGDIGSVERWLVRDDDNLGEESSMLNALGGGEAMGYLKQFTQASRSMGLGPAAVRQTLSRCMSWSKSLSVSFSFFFPLATKWESPIGAVGAMATMGSNSEMMGKWVKDNPELFAGIQKMFGGRGWITKDFIGFQDIMKMMDSNDPFLAEMYSWAHALGITMSDRLVNPMEPTKSVLASDINKLKEAVRDHMGAEAAAKFGRIADAMLLRQGDKAFSYALNATKLAVIAQLAMKLRYEAQRKGKAFDMVRDLKRYGGYINAEIGGIDPLRYAWAHPMNRSIMNTLMFSWQWTRGAWEAGGGGVIEDMLFGGHSVTRQEREYLLGRWCRMFGAVMIGVPMMAQAMVLALAKAIDGGDDDDDKWWTWQNEDKTRWTAFDITPLLRAIERADDTKLGGAIRRFKKDGGMVSSALGFAGGAALGATNGGNWLTAMIGGAAGAGVGSLVPTLVPMYTGDDAANSTTRRRRYYMHFGKQGWEFFRWFDKPGQQFFSKLSMPTQRILEGFIGRNLSYLDKALPWDDMGAMERWLNPTTDGALFNVAQAFLPFTVGGMTRTGDAGFLTAFGPVQMGASQTNVQDRLEKAITAWANNDREGYKWGVNRRGKASGRLQPVVTDILRDAELNGLDKEDQLNKALGKVLTKTYGRLFRLLPEDPSGDFDAAAINEVARSLNRLGAKKAAVMKSIKDRMTQRGRDWKSVLTPEERALYRSIVVGSLKDPYRRDDTRGIPEGTGFDY